LLLRENQRYVFEGFMGSLKQTLLWLGERGVEDGWLSHADAVRFVEFETLCAATRKQIEPEVMLQRVQRARMAWDKAGPQEAPDFLRGEEALMLPVGGHRLQGLGVSAGRVTATVRVLGSPADAKRLQPGDILVARSVDPGWTPLFATAGGLILELGGRLSHGAVVAREYQLPAVFQVGNATAALHDGQVVTLDGEQGLIWVSS
jgi:pyruvate,water dikinase